MFDSRLLVYLAVIAVFVVGALVIILSALATFTVVALAVSLSITYWQRFGTRSPRPGSNDDALAPTATPPLAAGTIRATPYYRLFTEERCRDCPVARKRARGRQAKIARRPGVRRAQIQVRADNIFFLVNAL